MKKLAVESLKKGGIYVGVVETPERDAQAVEWMREVQKQKDMETGEGEVLTQTWGVQQCAYVEESTQMETQVETQVETQMESQREMEGGEMQHGGLVKKHKRLKTTYFRRMNAGYF